MKKMKLDVFIKEKKISNLTLSNTAFSMGPFYHLRAKTLVKNRTQASKSEPFIKTVLPTVEKRTKGSLARKNVQAAFHCIEFAPPRCC